MFYITYTLNILILLSIYLLSLLYVVLFQYSNLNINNTCICCPILFLLKASKVSCGNFETLYN